MWDAVYEGGQGRVVGGRTPLTWFRVLPYFLRCGRFLLWRGRQAALPMSQ